MSRKPLIVKRNKIIMCKVFNLSLIRCSVQSLCSTVAQYVRNHLFYSKERSKFLLSWVLCFRIGVLKKGRKWSQTAWKLTLFWYLIIFLMIFSKTWFTCWLSRSILASLFNITHVPVGCKNDCYERRDDGAEFPFWCTLHVITAVNYSCT